MHVCVHACVCMHVCVHCASLTHVVPMDIILHVCDQRPSSSIHIVVNAFKYCVESILSVDQVCF